jgi:hypothetical protein
VLDRRPVAWALSLVVVGLVSAATLVLRSRVVGPLGRSPYDGLLHIRQARSLIDGDWLGSYDDLTLVKAPGYSLFLAGCHLLGIGAKAGEQVVVLLAALSLAVCVLAVVGRLSWAVPVFVVAAFDPVHLSTWSADYGRDALFSSITLLVVTLLFLTGHLLVVGRAVGWVLLAAVLGGACLAAYLLTREEGVTVLPVAAAALGAAPAIRFLRTGAHRRGVRPLLRAGVRAVPALLVLVLATGAPVAAVLAENDEHYGVATTSELAGAAFQGAYAQWQRVEAGQAVDRIPINEDQRQAVYAVSEAARDLEPALEDPLNQWRSSGCTTPPDCDYAGGWITWALRDAAADAGHFGSAADSAAFFDRLGAEIEQACADGRLTCRADIPGTLAPLGRITVTEFAEAFTRLTGSLLSSKDQFWQENRVPWGGTEQRAEFVSVDLGLPITGAGALGQTQDLSAHQWQYDVLRVGYSIGFPVGVGAGLVVVLVMVGTARGRRSAGPLTGLALALLFGAVLRIALISVIHASDYDADQPRYLYPAQVLLLAFAVVALVEGARVLDLRALGAVVRPPGRDRRPADAASGPADRPAAPDDDTVVLRGSGAGQWNPEVTAPLAGHRTGHPTGSRGRRPVPVGDAGPGTPPVPSRSPRRS